MKQILALVIALSTISFNFAQANPSMEGHESAMSTQEKQDAKLSAKHIDSRVKEIYNSLNNSKNPEAVYTSEQYYKLWQKIQEKDAQLVGEVGFINYNHWYQAQDFDNPRYEFGPAEKISETTTTVTLNIHDLGSTRKVILLMVYERGNWFIDDFITEKGQLFRSEKAELKKYLQE